jgi:hypothetical protein
LPPFTGINEFLKELLLFRRMCQRAGPEDQVCADIRLLNDVEERFVGIISLFSFVSAVVTIVIGWDEFVAIVLKLFSVP